MGCSAQRLEIALAPRLYAISAVAQTESGTLAFATRVSSNRLTDSEDALSPNDKTLGCGADEEKGIAGHEGQNLTGSGIQDGHIIRVNHFRRDDPVSVLRPPGGKRDDVILTYIPQRPKERVAVGSNGDVARNSWHSCT
jgi:hypothetical protein